MTAGTGGTLVEPTEAPTQAAPEPAPRRSSRARRRVRRRFWLVAVPLAVVVVVASVAAGELWRSQSGSRAAGPVTTTAAATTTAAIPAAPLQTLAVLHRGASGAADFVMLATGGGSPSFGQVTVLPPAAILLIPGEEPTTIADLGRGDDVAAIRTGLEAVFGVRVDDVALLDDIALRSALDATGPLDVQRPTATRVAPNDASSELVTTTDPAVRTGLLEAWLAALRDPLRSGPLLDVEPQLAPLVLAAAAPGTVTELVGTKVGSATRVEPDALAAAFAAIPVGAKLGINGVRPSVGVRDGVADETKLTNALRCLVRAGADIRAVEAVPTRFDQTAVTFADATSQASAQAMQEALGVGTVAPTASGDNSFDITVFVGADFSQCPQ